MQRVGFHQGMIMLAAKRAGVVVVDMLLKRGFLLRAAPPKSPTPLDRAVFITYLMTLHPVEVIPPPL